jgi:acyl-CoA thioesterase I
MMKPKCCMFIASACMCFAALTVDAQTRILPLGDSVTSSFVPHSSYRYRLWHKLVNAGFNVDFVGTRNGVEGGIPDNSNFDMDHEGHPGWTTQDGLDNIDAIVAATQPDMVLLDLGGNDVLEGVPLVTTVENLTAIIDHLRAANPNIRIVLAQSTPYQGQNAKRMSKLRAAVRRIARTHSRVWTVNLYGGFSVRKDTFDGTHPDDSGERKIAKAYFGLLKKLLR